jgi:Gram-negative bacterial TonB protein C-terminal
MKIRVVLRLVLLSALFIFSVIGVSAQWLQFCNVQLKAYDIENIREENPISLEGLKFELKDRMGNIVKPSKRGANLYEYLGSYENYEVVVALAGYKTSVKKFNTFCYGKFSPPAAASEYIFMQKGDPKETLDIDLMMRGNVSNAAAPLKISAVTPQPPILNKRAVNLVQPTVPVSETGNSVNIDGEVKVQVVVDEFGYVVWARVVSGHSVLRSNAVKAAFESRFKPETFANIPVKHMGIIIYNFAAQ